MRSSLGSVRRRQVVDVFELDALAALDSADRPLLDIGTAILVDIDGLRARLLEWKKRRNAEHL